MSSNEIRDLNNIYLEAVYGGEKKEEPKDDRMVVTAADKKGNTPAYQKYKAGAKNVKTGKPLYKAADHLKDDKDWGYDKKGNSLNPVDIEKRKKKDDDLAGSPKNEELKNIRSLVEKKKDTPDQVKAVIAFDKARKGTDDATYDSEHGDKEQAKKERDYAKWQRDKGAEDAQKSGHPWEHAKGSTREKEGKKSEKHAHIKDSFDPQREEQLWDEVAANLTELHELGGVKFKVVPFDLEEDDKWIQGAVKRPGAFTKKAKAAGMSVQQFAKHVDANKDDYSTRTERQANLAQTFASMKKEGADFDALSEFLINEGADEEAVNHIMSNWLLEGYQRNPEEGERKERADAKKREAIPGQARRGMPPRGDKKREEFEKWYAANVR